MTGPFIFFFSIHQFGGTKMWTPGRLMKILSVKSCQYFPPVGPSFGLHLNNKRNTNRGNNGGGPHLTSRMIGTRPLSADWDFSPSFFLISHRVIWQSISGTLECHRQCARFPLPLLPGFHSFLPFDKYLGATSIKNPPLPPPLSETSEMKKVVSRLPLCWWMSHPITTNRRRWEIWMQPIMGHTILEFCRFSSSREKDHFYWLMEPWWWFPHPTTGDAAWSAFHENFSWRRKIFRRDTKEKKSFKARPCAGTGLFCLQMLMDSIRLSRITSSIFRPFRLLPSLLCRCRWLIELNALYRLSLGEALSLALLVPVLLVVCIFYWSLIPPTCSRGGSLNSIKSPKWCDLFARWERPTCIRPARTGNAVKFSIHSDRICALFS